MNPTTREWGFNHDGYGIPADPTKTPMREQGATNFPVKPLAS